jgi:hypothetical protein
VSVTLSPQMRVVALVGALLVLAGATFALISARPSTTASSETPIVVHHAPKAAPHTTRPQTAHPHVAKHVRRNVINGLPAPLAVELHRHKIVVVAVYSPGSAVDKATVAAMRAGARQAHSGFVALDVTDRRRAAPLAAKLGALPVPSLLVFRRPDEVAFRLDGTVDANTVAQAVHDASSR